MPAVVSRRFAQLALTGVGAVETSVDVARRFLMGVATRDHAVATADPAILSGTEPSAATTTRVDVRGSLNDRDFAIGLDDVVEDAVDARVDELLGSLALPVARLREVEIAVLFATLLETTEVDVDHAELVVVAEQQPTSERAPKRFASNRVEFRIGVWLVAGDTSRLLVEVPHGVPLFR